MRLIDADALKRAIATIMPSRVEVNLVVDDQPDAIVRCKDCNECYFASNRVPHEQSWACGKHRIDITPDWFCADGKRKDS